MKPKRTTVGDLEPNMLFRLHRHGLDGEIYISPSAKGQCSHSLRTGEPKNFHNQSHVVVLGFFNPHREIPKMTKWYALLDTSEIVCLGEFEDFSAASDYADAKTGYNVVWIVDHDIAKDWKSSLEEIVA